MDFSIEGDAVYQNHISLELVYRIPGTDETRLGIMYRLFLLVTGDLMH